jgi:hypothetical protein
LTGVVAQIAGALTQIAARLFAAHWREEHAQSHTDSQPVKETFHSTLLHRIPGHAEVRDAVLQMRNPHTGLPL